MRGHSFERERRSDGSPHRAWDGGYGLYRAAVKGQKRADSDDNNHTGPASDAWCWATPEDRPPDRVQEY